jgi:hypothetical protein
LLPANPACLFYSSIGKRKSQRDPFQSKQTAKKMRTGSLLAILCPVLALAQGGIHKDNFSPLTSGDTLKKRARSLAASRLRVFTAGSIFCRLFPHKLLSRKIWPKKGRVVAISCPDGHTATNPAVIPLSAASEASIKEQADTLILTSTTLAALVEALNTAGRLGAAHTIIVDESCCARKLDIKLPLEALTNPDRLRQTLRAHGLALTPVHRRLSMFVLTEDPPPSPPSSWSTSETGNPKKNKNNDE